jgi:D-glycero-beta-D-manno-heptose-7-phosphate kinase
MIDAEKIFTAFENLNVLIVGDVMIDRYLTGKVDRVSPEAPVPVVQLYNSENRLGGAANVALNIQAMGAKAHLCSVIGKDENAELFLKLMPQEDLNPGNILQSDERKTTVKTRVIASNQHLLRVDTEDTHELSKNETERFLSTLKSLLNSQKIDVILFQDYNKGVLTDEVINAIIQQAIQRNIPTAVDPKKDNFLSFKKTTLFKPNLKEVREALPFSIDPNLSSLQKASNFLRQKLDHQNTLITLSEKGIFADNGTQSMILPTQPRNITDVCGAGDTVIGIAALGLAISMDLKDIAMLTNLAGGQVCEKVGVVPVNKKQLKAEYEKLIG